MCYGVEELEVSRASAYFMVMMGINYMYGLFLIHAYTNTNHKNPYNKQYPLNKPPQK